MIFLSLYFSNVYIWLYHEKFPLLQSGPPWFGYFLDMFLLFNFIECRKCAEWKKKYTYVDLPSGDVLGPVQKPHKGPGEMKSQSSFFFFLMIFISFHYSLWRGCTSTFFGLALARQIFSQSFIFHLFVYLCFWDVSCKLYMGRI